MSDTKPVTRYVTSVGTWTIVASVLLGAVTVFVGTSVPPQGEEPNRLATALLQGITLVFGTVGSFLLAREGSEQAVRARISPHARSAFRRVLTLYEALGRLRRTALTEAELLADLTEAGSGEAIVRLDLALASLDKIRLMSDEQIATAGNALDDWRDLAPDEVAAIEKAAADAAGIPEGWSL